MNFHKLIEELTYISNIDEYNNYFVNLVEAHEKGTITEKEKDIICHLLRMVLDHEIKY